MLQTNNAVYRLLAAPTPLYYETKLAHLSKYYIRCSVFCIKSHPGFSVIEAVQNDFSVTLSPAPAAGDYTALQFLPADRQAIAECLR